MTERSDHLIERAAALLRSANASRDERAATPPPPQRPDVGNDAPAAPSGPPPRPRLSPPQPTAFVDPGARARKNLIVGGSVAELRGRGDVPPVSLATLEAAGLMVARGGRTRTTEEYRIVMGRVLRALYEDEDGVPLQPAPGSANVVLVTSARPGEGKSFTALNLSGSVAQNAGESVLLIDVDAKRNSLTDRFGLADRPGFLDLVTNNELRLEDLIVPTDLPQLSVLPIGQRVGGRSNELMDMSYEARRLAPPIARLAERFPRSLMILDAPPCLSTSDPHTFAPVVGQVVMVVEAERTQKSELEAALDLVRVCPNITMLLNKVRTSSGHTFGSYDYFGSYT